MWYALRCQYGAQLCIGYVIKTVFLVATQNICTGAMRKWPAQVGTVVANVGSHYWKWRLIWQMQTTCRFFYGTNWSPAANSGQRGPWSKVEPNDILVPSDPSYPSMPDFVVADDCLVLYIQRDWRHRWPAGLTTGFRIFWGLGTEVSSSLYFDRLHSTNSTYCVVAYCNMSTKPNIQVSILVTICICPSNCRT